VGGIVLGVLAIVMLVLAIRQPRTTVAVPPPTTTETGQQGTTTTTTPMDQGPADTET
jgi:hypothetical protein